jgi:hypothetical protein
MCAAPRWIYRIFRCERESDLSRDEAMKTRARAQGWRTSEFGVLLLVALAGLADVAGCAAILGIDPLHLASDASADGDVGDAPDDGGRAIDDVVGETPGRADADSSDAGGGVDADATASTPGCHTAPMDLVHWYRGQNDTADSVTGPDNAPATWLPGSATAEYAEGYVGRGFSVTFGEYLDVHLDLKPPFTIDLWAEITAAEGPYQTILGLSDVPRSAAALSLDCFPRTGPCKVDFADGGAVDAGSVSVGSWVHYALATEVARTRVYENGQLVATYGSTDAYVDLSIGEGFVGNLDEVHVFSNALSAEEIQGIFSADGGLCP